MRHWILVGQTPIEVSLREWAEWFDKHDREWIIEQTTVTARDQKYNVSTVFLGIESTLEENGVPELFETMVFTDDEAWANYEERWRSYLEAKRGHRWVKTWIGSRAKP